MILDERLYQRVEVIFLLIIVCIVAACSKSQPNTNIDISHKPNILLIMTDDQGWGDLSLHGNESIETPNLDRLAKESTRFNRFYVSPVCAPTRASLLTGRYHLRTGTSWVTHRKEVMRSEEVTIAEILRDAGYSTGIFGKWHNGEQYPHNPQGQGFDTFFGFSSGHWNNYFDTQVESEGETVRTTGFITDVLTDQAIEFIHENQDDPFLCYVPYNAPHGPFQVPDKYFNKYKSGGLDDKTAAVYGMVENVDDNVGLLLQTLDSLQLKENTIVVFLTDNGPNGRRYNGGMKGVKGNVDEGGVRVPFFIRWPGKIRANHEIETIASHIDVLPTLAQLCGISLPDSLALDGVSLGPLLSDNAEEWKPRNIYTHQVRQTLAMTLGSVRSDRHRLVLRNDSTLLYDMIQDPFQTNDISVSQLMVANKLRADYISWFEDVTKNYSSPPPIEIGYEKYTRIRLPAHEAKLTGNIKFKGGMGWANDYIVNWISSEDVASWDINIKRPSEIEVSMWYTASENSVGSEVKIEMNGEELRSSISEVFDPEFIYSPDRVPRGEVYEKRWTSIVLGSLKSEAGIYDINLRIVNNLDAAGLDVKMLELTQSDL